MQPTLYLMMGYPGSGKTTTAQVISELTGAVHLSSDNLRLELFPKPSFSEDEHNALYKVINEQTEKLLSSGVSVIYDANLNRYSHRKEKYDICERTNARPVLLWLKTDKDLAKKRATHQDRTKLSTPSESLAEMFERIAGVIEEPQEREKAVEVDGTKVSQRYIANLLKIEK